MLHIYRMLDHRKDESRNHSCYPEYDEEACLGQLFKASKNLSEREPCVPRGGESAKCIARKHKLKLKRKVQVW